MESSPDGYDALVRERTRPASLVLVDLDAPPMGGICFCRTLRSEGITTPVLMISGGVQSHDPVAGLEAGADDYLTKPFEYGELFARLRALLRRGGLKEGRSDLD